MTALPRPPGDTPEISSASLRLAGHALAVDMLIEDDARRTASLAWSGLGRLAFDAATAAGHTWARSGPDSARQVAAALTRLAHAVDTAHRVYDREQRRVDDAHAEAARATMIASEAASHARRLADLVEHETALHSAAAQATADAVAAARSAARTARRLEATLGEARRRIEAAIEELDTIDRAIAAVCDGLLVDGDGGRALLARLAITPLDVRSRYVAGLAPGSVDLLISHDPDLLVRLAGLPVGLLASAQRARISTHVTQLQTAIDRQRRLVTDLEFSILAWFAWRTINHERQILLDMEHQLEIHSTFLQPGRTIVEWSPVGDGRVVEVIGDLDRARHIAVLVPGITNTIHNYDDNHRVRAMALHEAAADRADDVAVVSWLGYDTPGITGALSKTAAETAAPELSRFVRSLDPEGSRHVTVVAHSYGTVVAALASLEADELVLVGSPGVPLAHASEARLREGGRVWAMVADDDLVGRLSIGVLGCGLALPTGRLGPACTTDGDGDVIAASHGFNPAAHPFGATELDAGGISGHSAYFDPAAEALGAIADVVVGLGSATTDE